MSDLRQRKPVQDVTTQPTQELEEDDKEHYTNQAPPDMRPDLGVMITLLLILMTVITTYWYYRVDRNSKGPFSTFVNDKILGYDPYARGGPVEGLGPL
jgi:hypothetical protein